MNVSRTTLDRIAHFREQFLEENNIQFIYDKCHRYGWADTYLFSTEGKLVGYGSVWGKERREDRDTVFEFYLIGDARKIAKEFFQEFCLVSGAIYIECQSNDQFLYPMFEEYAVNKQTEAILFCDDHETKLQIADATIEINEQTNQTDRQYVLRCNGHVAGKGGFMLNYNFPYADIYYEILDEYRRRGLGSYFVQELKKEIYGMGRVPAARCNVSNHISKATLLKAGMMVCGLRVNGDIQIKK